MAVGKARAPSRLNLIGKVKVPLHPKPAKGRSSPPPERAQPEADHQPGTVPDHVDFPPRLTRTVLGPNPDPAHEDFFTFLQPGQPAGSTPSKPSTRSGRLADTENPQSSSSRRSDKVAAPQSPRTHPSTQGGESTPPHERTDTEEDLLRRMERVFVRNNRARRSAPFQTGGKQASPANSERSLPTPSSKAVIRRRFNTSVPETPRYGPESLPARDAPSSPTPAPNPEVVALAHGISERRQRRDEARNEVIQLWARLEHPQATDSLIVESNIADDVLVMMKRGRRFAELAPRIGVNQATKRSRGFNQHQLGGFSAGAEQFIDAVKNYNLRVIHLRSVRPSMHAPAKKKRRTHML